MHIPFCVQKCAYCDFLSGPAARETQEAYVRALKGEIRESREMGRRYEVSAVFFGGGTPSVLKGEEIAGILEEIREDFSLRRDTEITVECNPGTLTAEKLDWYRRAGINRLSLGLQSAQNRELRLLGRIHTWEEFLESFRLVREAGFRNINIDLMSALPGQTRESWADTLEKVAALEPEHISAYSLILEEGTPLYERYKGREELSPCDWRDKREASQEVGKGLVLLPDEDTERQMYYDTKDILGSRGFHRYEISNYALPGRECRQNLGYWRRTEYRGFGIGAASLVDGYRFQNGRELLPYIKGQYSTEEEETLTDADILSETMFLGLRTAVGVRLTDQMRQVYKKVIEKHISQGLLTEQDGKLRLTDRGIDISNWVLADFLLDTEL